MKNEKNYYQEIRRYQQNLTEKEAAVVNLDSLFFPCQQFYHYYSIRNQISSAEKVLQNYFTPDNYIAQRKINANADVKATFTLKDKLYLEFLGEIYDEYYSNKMNYEEFILDEEWKELVSRCFNKKPNTLLDILSGIMDYALRSDLEDYIYRKHDFSKIHNAMVILKEGLNLSMPSLEESAEKVIAEKQLERINDYLEYGNIPGAIFVIAPIRRALWDGEYKSYLPKSGHKTVYFNIASEYNTVQLKNRVNALEELLKDYEIEMKEINNLRKMFVDRT